MGTDPEEFLGYNPFTASIEIKLHSDYANSDSIAKIEKMIKKNKICIRDRYWPEFVRIRWIMFLILYMEYHFH